MCLQEQKLSCTVDHIDDHTNIPHPDLSTGALAVVCRSQALSTSALQEASQAASKPSYSEARAEKYCFGNVQKCSACGETEAHVT